MPTTIGSIPDIRSLRRQFHRWPELGFLELRTASTIYELLSRLGYSLAVGREVMVPELRMGLPTQQEFAACYEDAVRNGFPIEILDRLKDGFTGIVASLSGRIAGPTVALRFDMDALPLDESGARIHRPTAEGFRSQHDGVMHACGHDGHIAIGLEVAARLADRDFPGTALLVFQPGEEGARGAKGIAESGVLDEADVLICLHLGLGLPTGTVYGGTCGTLATFKIRADFAGSAAHAGLEPEKGRSALLAAASAVLAAHSLPQYGSSNARLNVGVLQSGSAPNIVPEKALLVLETRASQNAVNEDLAGRALNVLEHSARLFDVTCQTQTIGAARTFICDKELVAAVTHVAKAVPSVKKVGDLFGDNGSEDASWLVERVQDKGGQATYIIVGSDSPGGHHQSDFDVDERSLLIATTLLERLVRTSCGRMVG